MNTVLRHNLITYTIFLLIALTGIYYGEQIKPDHQFLRVWSFQNILILLIGVPFLFLQHKARLPDFWERTIPNKNRIYYPLLLGAAFGIADIAVIKGILHPEPYTELPPFLQPFPYALFLYTSGAFEIEVFYRLIPLTIILFLGTWYKQGRYYTTFLWVAMILTAFREPLEQLPQGPVAFVVYSLATGLGMNFIQAWYYKQAGFLASLVIRLGHYLFWHIVLGIYVEFVELG